MLETRKSIGIEWLRLPHLVMAHETHCTLLPVRTSIHEVSFRSIRGEKTFSSRGEDATVRQADMTFRCVPGLRMDDWGLELNATPRVRRQEPAARQTDAVARNLG